MESVMSLSSDKAEELMLISARQELDKLPKNSLMYAVNRGLLGYNQGLSNGLTQYTNKYLKGTHRGRYYLLGADSGVGKTTMADFMFAYNLIKACEAKGLELELDYYSWEISETPKKAKWASLLYAIKYGVFISSDLILSMSNEEEQRMNYDQWLKVKGVANEIDELFKKFNFIEAGKTPTDVWKRMCERAARTGDLVKKSSSVGSLGDVVGYIPTKEQPVRWSIFDHVALGDPLPGLSLKANIDLLSTHLVRARNLFGDSCTVIQQFNTEMQHAARERKSVMAYMPTRQDFGDSRYTYRDADVVIGLVRPLDFGLTEMGPFTQLDEWGSFFLLFSIMKNRYGASGKTIPMFMNYVAGMPEELKAETWNEMVQDMYKERAKTLHECL